MSTPPDWDDLARRYLDLWQQNISAAAADPDTARDLAQLIGGFGAFMGAGAAVPPQSASDMAALTAALKGIERRLAAIERRLGGLASGMEDAARKPASAKAGAVEAKPVEAAPKTPAKPRAARRRPGGAKKD